MAQELTKLVEEFMKLPDSNRFPLPEIFYLKYGVPRPKHNNDDLKGSVTAAVTSMNAGGVPFEERGPAEGGVREVKLPDPVLSKVIPAPVLENESNTRESGGPATDTQFQQLSSN